MDCNGLGIVVFSKQSRQRALAQPFKHVPLVMLAEIHAKNVTR